MSEVFLKVVNMSISAGWLVLAVLALRLILKKAPKWVNVLLWGIVAIRLICPVSIESALSLIPSRETISPEIMMDWTPEISTGVSAIDRVVNPVISASFAPNPMSSANPLQILIPVAANLWLLGVLILLAFTAISYLSLRRKLITAVILRDNIFQCGTVSSPFVLGILKPRIYLPYAMDGQNLQHVVAHEQAHIRRKDHWWKPLGFMLLAVHWFNPFVWVAYILLCRDIELACDEKVIAELGNEQRADYTQALVACAVNRRMIAACPLAFGEVGVKDRVKSIMNYRKPTFWIIMTALVVCALVAVCFLTDPMSGHDEIREDRYYLQIGAEEVYSIEVSTPYTGGGCANADNTPFRKGEIIWLEQLDSSSDLRGVTICAFEWNGNAVYSFSVPDDASNDEITQLLEEDSWLIIPEKTVTKLSLNDLIILSQKGYDLSWSDFEDFEYIETGSGLYIRRYEINDLFHFAIGGAGPNSEPMYMYLGVNGDDPEARIDIREGGVTEFIEKHHLRMLAFELNYAGNTSIHHRIEVTKEQPYWCILIENQGPERIVAEIGGDVYEIEFGTHLIFSEEKWKPGIYDVSFATGGSSGMVGNAVCYTYQYRLEITGRLPNAVQDITYILLSNMEEITFEQAWKASGLSSNLDDYFDQADAVFIGVR